MVIDVPCIAIENDLPTVFENEEDMPEKPTLTQRMEIVEEALQRLEGADSWGNWFKSKTNKVMLGGVLFSALCAGFAVYPLISAHVREDRENEISAQVNKQIGPVNDALQKLSGQVSRIGDNVDILLRNGLKTTSSLTQPQFNQNLGVVSTQLDLARQLKAKLDEQTRNALRERLLESSLSADKDLWQARINFLSYESASFSTVTWDRSGQENLGICANGPMAGLTFDAKFRCRFDLDGAILKDFRIENAVVIYHGGPTSLDNVVLVNCYLVLDIHSVPDKGGQKFIENLLASVPSDVSISG